MDEVGDIPDIDAVLSVARPTLLDPELEPEPVLCRTCRKEHRWSWWPGRGTVRGRWCPPPSPCTACAFTQELLDDRAELVRRQEIAEIAEVHRKARWSARLVQQLDESWTDFARRVKRQPGQLGVAVADLPASRIVGNWRPGDGGIFLSGPIGSGKSQWLSALLTELIAPTSGGRVTLDVEQQVRLGVPPATARRAVETGCNVWVTPKGAQRYQALVVDEDEIVRRVRLSWKGDQVPLLKISRSPVLLYDDIGTVILSHGKGADLARDCLDRMIDLRWREGRPLLATSNRSLDEICDALGRKTADRLRALFDHQLELRGVPEDLVAKGFSWRRIP